jgi:hypothetical protein
LSSATAALDTMLNRMASPAARDCFVMATPLIGGPPGLGHRIFELILMTAPAASKAAMRRSPAGCACKGHANCLKPKEIRTKIRDSPQFF